LKAPLLVNGHTLSGESDEHVLSSNSTTAALLAVVPDSNPLSASLAHESDTDDGEETDDLLRSIKVDPLKAQIAQTKMLAARSIGPDGTEQISDKVLQKVEFPNLKMDATEQSEDPYAKHWRTQCEYELLPLVQNPFQEFDLFIGKDPVHQSFFDKVRCLSFCSLSASVCLFSYTSFSSPFVLLLFSCSFNQSVWSARFAPTSSLIVSQTRRRR
jgi:hypothetical protein